MSKKLTTTEKQGANGVRKPGTTIKKRIEVASDGMLTIHSLSDLCDSLRIASERIESEYADAAMAEATADAATVAIGINENRSYKPEIPLRQLRIESMIEFLKRRGFIKLHANSPETEIAKELVKTKIGKIEIRKEIVEDDSNECRRFTQKQEGPEVVRVPVLVLSRKIQPIGWKWRKL
jgi:hypothetical protein